MRRTLSAVGGLALGWCEQFPNTRSNTPNGWAARSTNYASSPPSSTARPPPPGSAAKRRWRYTTTGDDFVAGRGLSMAGTFRRYEALTAALAEIQAQPAGSGSRCCQNISTATSANARCRISGPACGDDGGFAYAGVGFLAGYFIVSGVVSFSACRPGGAVGLGR